MCTSRGSAQGSVKKQLGSGSGFKEYGSEIQGTVNCFTWEVNSSRKKTIFQIFLHRVGKLWYMYLSAIPRISPRNQNQFRNTSVGESEIQLGQSNMRLDQDKNLVTLSHYRNELINTAEYYIFLYKQHNTGPDDRPLFLLSRLHNA